MKTITRSNMYLTMAAMILTAALAVPAAAKEQVPFKGTLQGLDVHLGMPSPGIGLLGTSGTGIGAHVGQFSFTQESTVNLANRTLTGSGHWIAANGDSIDTTIAGSFEPTATPDIFSFTEIHTITGGTGRFAGAQGSFTVERLASGVTFLTSGSFHGTITSPDAAQ
jgi:hypothetical protein